MAAQQVVILTLLLIYSSLIHLSDAVPNCELSNISVPQKYYDCTYKYENGKYLKCRILYYANSNASFQLELLVCGDIEVNPGPTTESDDFKHPPCISSTSNDFKPCKIYYSRNELLYLNKYDQQTAPHLPCDLWNHLKNLSISNRCRLPRKKRGGRKKPRRSGEKSDFTITSPADYILERTTSITDPDNPDACVNLCVLNARSVRNKTHILCDYIVDNDLDIFAITESWLSDSNKHKKTIGELSLPGYDLFHVPRPNRRGGVE